MKKWAFLIFILLITNVPVFSQADTTVENTHHSINVNPLGILGGAIGLNYELLLMRQHGLFIEGSYIFPLFPKNKGYGAGVSYRFHLHQRMKSNFIGIFYRMGYAESVVQDQNRVNYDFSIKNHVAGINYGWRNRLFKTKLQYCYRVGLGVPFTTFKWGTNGKPESLGGISSGTFENIYKYSALLDVEFSIGYSL
jgi:hypothetical protein